MKKIAEIVSDTHPQLSKLITSQNAIVKIKSILATLDLFTQYKNDYCVTKFSQGIVYVNVSTAALATQIRHQAPMMLRILQKNLSDISFNAIQCKVSSVFSLIKNEALYQKNKPMKLSNKTKTKLAELSERMDSKELSAVIKKLVS